jgi:hypothetical protein
MDWPAWYREAPVAPERALIRRLGVCASIGLSPGCIVVALSTPQPLKEQRTEVLIREGEPMSNAGRSALSQARVGAAVEAANDRIREGVFVNSHMVNLRVGSRKHAGTPAGSREAGNGRRPGSRYSGRPARPRRWPG